MSAKFTMSTWKSSNRKREKNIKNHSFKTTGQILVLPKKPEKIIEKPPYWLPTALFFFFFFEKKIAFKTYISAASVEGALMRF